MTSKQARLDKLKDEIIADNVTPELAAQATQLVFGDGHPNADIVFIGEAPGKNEDLQGKPFVGAAGKFLNEMLEMIGLSRDNIYITNIVKYRPPNNRDPFPDEKATFLPYLKEQLDIIEPKLIVMLGRHSMESLLPGLKISQVHGQPKRVKILMSGASGHPGVSGMQGAGEDRTKPYKSTVKEEPEPATQQVATRSSQSGGSASDRSASTWVILPLFHPAAALYNGAMRQTLIDDFAKIPAIMELIETN